MKRNYFLLNKDIQECQDEIIENYDNKQAEKKNKGRLDNLMGLIKGQDWGAQIINDCAAFQGHKMKELAKKFNTKDIDVVLN